MNSEELKKEFGLLMPSEINGFKRPDESIPSSNDFFLEIPQLISKDPVLYSTMNLIFSVILSNDKLLKQWIDTLQNVVNAQDWRVVTDSLKGYMTPELKKKLDGIANGANNYVHPSSHPASMIAQDATHRFVSDTEKNTWNGKASTSLVSTTANGLMPKRDGSATSIFTGDGVWKSLAWDLITGKPSTFAPSAHNHDGSYLKLSGGSLTGALNLANGTLNLAGDDCYFGHQNIAGGFCLKGANGTTNLTFINKDNPTQMASLSYAGGNLISNATIQGNLSGTATSANNLEIIGSLGYIKYGGGDVDENTAISQNKVNLLIGSWYSTGFRDLCSTGNPIRVAINHRNGNIKTTGNVIADGAMYTVTPATTDNSTRVATTEFVRNLINQFKNDGTLGGIVGGSLTQNGWVKFSNGLILQWGTFNSGSNGYCTFPISFNSTCFNVTTCGKSGGAQNTGGSAGEFPPYNINLKGFYYSRWQCGSGNLVGSFWVSIGI